MKVIVVGMGQVGRQTAFMLAMDGHDIIIVDHNEKSLAEAEEKMDVMAYGGNGASPNTLKNAMIEVADLLIAVTNNDEINLLAATIAKQLNPKCSTLCRVANKEFLPDSSGYYANHLGVDMVISPNILTAIEINKIVKSTSALASQDFAKNKIQFIKIAATENSSFIGKTIFDLKLPEMVSVIAIAREDDVIFPTEDEEICSGDYLFFLGSIRQIKKIEKQFDVQKAFKNRKIMLVGASEISLEIAEELERLDAGCILVDKNQDKCQQFSEKLNSAEIVNGDATDVTFLREESIQNVDVFVSLTEKDEINLMTTLLAKREGVYKTIALTQNAEYSNIYGQLGVDVTISPRLIAAQHILGFIQRGKIAKGLILVEDKAEIIEVALHEHSRICGKVSSDVNLPSGASIPFVVTEDGDVLRTDSIRQFEPNDRLIIVTKPNLKSSIERQIKRKSVVI